MDLKLDIGGVSAEIDLEDAAERLLQISVTDPLNAGLNAGINAGINAGLNVYCNHPEKNKINKILFLEAQQ